MVPKGPMSIHAPTELEANSKLDTGAAHVFLAWVEAQGPQFFFFLFFSPMQTVSLVPSKSDSRQN